MFSKKQSIICIIPFPDTSLIDDASDGSSVGGSGGAIDLSAHTPQPITRRRRTRSMTRSPSPVKTDSDVQQTALDTLDEEDSDCSPPPRKIPTTPGRVTPARRRQSIRSTTRSPSPKAGSVAPRAVLDTVAEDEPPIEQAIEAIDEDLQDEIEKADPSEANDEFADTAEAELDADEEMPEEDRTSVAKTEAEPVEEVPDSATIDKSSAASANNGDKVEAERNDDKKANSGEEKPNEAATGDDKSTGNLSADVNLIKPERSTEPRVVEFTSVESEPDLPESGIYLSWMDSDLHLLIDSSENFLAARPIHESHLLSAYAGCRATHGVRTGRVAYEVHVDNIIHTNQFDPPKYDIRVGWSTRSTSLQLGEAPLSFGYTMQRRKALAGVFTEYGMLLRTGDVVGVYLDLESEPCRVEYTVNGKSQGVAFEFERSELGDAALYPHVLSKCVTFKCNFSDRENLLVNTTQPEFTEPDEKHERRMIAPSNYFLINYISLDILNEMFVCFFRSTSRQENSRRCERKCCCRKGHSKDNRRRNCAENRRSIIYGIKRSH